MGSIFDILGPVMVGPSSSHTAGAARIGYTARQLFDEPVKKAEVYLHGSFAATGKGHGTDRAIIAGLLGMKPDDLRIPVAFEEAKKAGMEFTIANRELKNAHPNTARVVMENAEGRKMVLQAYSIGGGRIRVSILDGIEVDFSGESNTLIVRNMDRPGCITEVSAALSREKINVATMQVFRHKRGGAAEELRKKEDILEVISLNLETGTAGLGDKSENSCAETANHSASSSCDCVGNYEDGCEAGKGRKE